MLILKSERVLQEGVNRLGNAIYLLYRPEGVYPAGSRPVEQEGDRWYVSWELGNARHGRSFVDPAKARDFFAMIRADASA